MDRPSAKPKQRDAAFEIPATPTSPPSEHSNTTPRPSNQSPPSSNKASASRRKSGHHRLILDDDISFETVVLTEDDSPTHSVSSPPIASTSGLQDYLKENLKQKSSPKKRKQNDGDALNVNAAVTIGDETNPNERLMKKAAFLRVSANYLMLLLGMKPFDFDGPMGVSDMIGVYSRQKRLAQTRNEERCRQI